MTRRWAMLAMFTVFMAVRVDAASATEAAWALISGGGYTILLTNADAPGIGDPPYFELDDCSTQRNLSDRGRQQSRRWGVKFATRSISISRLYSSRWCRALDTAANAFRSPAVEPLAALDLIQNGDGDVDAKIEGVMEVIRNFRGPGNQVMVTHDVNVEALTGVTPRTGEALIVVPKKEVGEGEPPLRVINEILLN